MNFGDTPKTSKKANDKKLKLWVSVWFASIFLGDAFTEIFLQKLYHKLVHIVEYTWSSQEKSLFIEIFIDNRYVFEILIIMVFFSFATCLLLAYDNLKKDKNTEN